MPKESKLFLSRIRVLEKRVSVIEKSLRSGVSPLQKRSPHSAGDFSGPSGGVKFLVSQHYFKKAKRSLSDVVAELDDRGYTYSVQAYHEALKRASERNGPLVKIKVGNRFVYGERK